MGDTAFELGAGMIIEQPPADGDSDIVDIERTSDGKEPTPFLILLADADRLTVRYHKARRATGFDQRALLLDNDNLVETSREFLKPCGSSGQGQPTSKPAARAHWRDFVDAHLVERLADIEIGFTRRDNADLRLADRPR